MGDPFDLRTLQINPADPALMPARGRAPRARKPRYFVKVPWDWVVRLDGASGQTYRLALNLLFLHWKGRGASITLANRTLESDGIPPQTKRRALRDLERRGLVTVNWRENRSPVVHVLVDAGP
jgi:hypothetical protein